MVNPDMVTTKTQKAKQLLWSRCNVVGGSYVWQEVLKVGVDRNFIVIHMQCIFTVSSNPLEIVGFWH